MSTFKLYCFYFIYGAINSIAIQMLPLVMTQKGFSPSQVTIILSFVFLAALFQPLIGFMTRAKTGSKLMLEMLLGILFIMAILIFINTSFIAMLLIVLVFSIARSSISPIYDSYATMASRDYKINYGLVRSGASLGFGTGMAIYTLVANSLGLQYNASFLLLSFVAVISFLIISTMPKEKVSASDTVSGEAETKLAQAILLIVIYTLYFGALSIRISYLSSFYVEFGYSTSFISLATFALVIPEVIFLPLYNKLFAKRNKVLLMAIAIVFGIIQMGLYIVFHDFPVLLLFACLFNGLQIMLFFPTYVGLLQDSLGPKNSAFGFVMNMTMQSLFVGIFNLVVIHPVVVKYASTIPIFYLVIGLEILAFIPLFVYKVKYYRK